MTKLSRFFICVLLCEAAILAGIIIGEIAWRLGTRGSL